MKKIFVLAIAVMCGISIASAQSIIVGEGKCSEGVSWSFDGITLSITNTSKEQLPLAMKDYTLDKPAPWIKKGYAIKKVNIGAGISRIGSCAFANCNDLLEVEFESFNLKEIGWGAFLGCGHLRTISLPMMLERIETIAFANCTSLTNVFIPDGCRVEEQAYLSCDNLSSISVSETSVLGHLVFAGEKQTPQGVRHTALKTEIKRLPSYINSSNCQQYGLSKASVEDFLGDNVVAVDYDKATSEIDSDIPLNTVTRNTTYALVIGNQDYRFVPDVPYAIHDARVFAEYCSKTLGIPTENIHICENATKHMILEDEIEWLDGISDREDKVLFVYYAGHGVPDMKDSNRAYLLPSDVRGTRPDKGIALDDFYGKLGAMEFGQVRVFLDACFSGVSRDNESVNEGLREVEIEAEEAEVSKGNVVVFSAAKGNETAQGYTEQGHGLFTYYLLKAIRDNNGRILLGDLSDGIISDVSKAAPTMRLRKPQTPTTNASENVANYWRQWAL